MKGKLRGCVNWFVFLLGIVGIILCSNDNFYDRFEESILGIGALSVVFFIYSFIAFILWVRRGNDMAVAEQNRQANEMAKHLGYDEYKPTLGGEVFSIDSSRGLWKAQYIRNMEKFNCMGELSHIKGYSIEPVYEEKSNAMGRAVAGGVLFGGAGAVVGAMTSSSQKIETNDCYLTISTDYSDYGTQRYKMETSFGKAIIKVFDEYFREAKTAEMEKKNAQVPAEQPAETIEPMEKDTSLSKRLHNLKELFEQDLITSEEYEEKRKEIIDHI